MFGASPPVAVGRVAIADGVNRLHRGDDAVTRERINVVGVQQLRVLDTVRHCGDPRHGGEGAERIAVGAVADRVDSRSNARVSSAPRGVIHCIARSVAMP